MPQRKWTLFINCGAKLMIVELKGENPEDTPISYLRNVVTSAIVTDEYRIHYGGVDLQSDKCIKEYCTLKHGSTLDILFTLGGGSASNTRTIDPTIKRSKGPCLAIGTCFPTKDCVVMPCGDSIHPDGLADYCKSEVIHNHKLQIRCFKSGCDKEWPISYISKCGLTAEEISVITKTISLNFMNYDSSIHTCPGCGLYCSRLNPTDKIVRCARCTAKRGSVYDFCWLCSSPWAPSHKCKIEARNEFLASAAKKEITTSFGMKCPSVRACPKCFNLIEHNGGCKHMTCSSCKQGFCFVCLRLNTDGKWHCGTYSTKCEPAPVQVLKG